MVISRYSENLFDGDNDNDEDDDDDDDDVFDQEHSMVGKSSQRYRISLAFLQNPEK